MERREVIVKRQLTNMLAAANTLAESRLRDCVVLTGELEDLSADIGHRAILLVVTFVL